MSKEEKASDPLVNELLKFENTDFPEQPLNEKEQEEELKKEIQKEYAHYTSSELAAECALASGIYKEQQGNLEEAEKDYLYAVNLHPESFEAHKCLAILYHKQRKFEKAIKHYEIICKPPTEYLEMLSNLAVCYSHIGKYDKAISLYIQILKKKNDFRVWINLSSTYLSKGKLENAMKCIEKVLEDYPKNGMALYTKGLILEKEGKIIDALHCFGQSLVLVPKETQIKRKFEELVQKSGGFEKLPPEIREYWKQWEKEKYKLK